MLKKMLMLIFTFAFLILKPSYSLAANSLRPDYMKAGLYFSHELAWNGSWDSKDVQYSYLAALFTIGKYLNEKWRTNLDLAFGRHQEWNEKVKKTGYSAGFNLFILRDFNMFWQSKIYLGFGAGLMHLSPSSGWQEINDSGVLGTIGGVAGISKRIYKNCFLEIEYKSIHISDLLKRHDKGHNNDGVAIWLKWEF